MLRSGWFVGFWIGCSIFNGGEQNFNGVKWPRTSITKYVEQKKSFQIEVSLWDQASLWVSNKGVVFRKFEEPVTSLLELYFVLCSPQKYIKWVLTNCWRCPYKFRFSKHDQQFMSRGTKSERNQMDPNFTSQMETKVLPWPLTPKEVFVVSPYKISSHIWSIRVDLSISLYSYPLPHTFLSSPLNYLVDHLSYYYSLQ